MLYVILKNVLMRHHWSYLTHLSKDAGHRPASLLQMLLFQSCFSNILAVKTSYLVPT